MRGLRGWYRWGQQKTNRIRQSRNQKRYRRYARELFALSDRLYRLHLGWLFHVESATGTQVMKLHRRWVLAIRLLRCHEVPSQD